MTERLPRACAVLAALSGILALTGWTAEVESLRSVVPGGVAMNPTSAVGLITAAVALFVTSRGEQRRLMTGLTLCVVAIGSIKLCAYVVELDLGIDRVLFSRKVEAESLQPNRMAPNTALCFVLIGASLWLLTQKRRIVTAQLLALGCGLVALSAILGYVYDLTDLYRISTHIPMAPNTAIAFAALSLGTLSARPAEGITAVFASPTAGGFVARRLLPAAIGLPIILGASRLWGERAGLYERETGLLLMVVMTVLLMTAVVWWTAGRIDRADRDRRSAVEALSESSLFLESIFENLPSMVFVKEAGDLRFVKLNRAGEDLLGFDRNELIGRNDHDFFPPEQADFFIAKDREVLAGTEPVDIPEEPIRTAKLGTRLLHTQKVPLAGPDGRPRYLLGISEDITDRKRAEERIQSLNRELEAFSYSVSHDLRAPLRAIVGFSQALLEDHAQQLDEQGASLLRRIIAAGHRMARLIDDLLVLSRVGRAEMSRRTVDLTALARDVEQGLREAEPDRAVEVVIPDHLTARGDPHLLRSVIENLLDNAWKYTGRGAGTRIEIGVLPAENGGSSTFFIKDDGAGFDMAYADKLFAPFQRLHSSHEFHGTGIGLATVHRIIQRHGGRIWAEAAVGEGAAFYFTLDEAEPWMTS